jgi:serine phosphatase RsbU (regulator of sigma subunit)
LSTHAAVISGEAVGSIEILVIEDDPADALLAEEFLLEEGADFSVTWARTLSEGLRAIGPTTACVLLDLGLPDAQGVAALARVRRVALRTPVVVLTGLGDRAAGMRAVAAGAQDYLVKGEVTPATLARSVRYAIERLGNEERDRQLFEAELRREENARLARGLQPQLQVGDTDLCCATLYQPAGGDNPLGGDFLDAVELGDGTVRLLIGDVAGHGPEEAALGVSLRVGWRSLVLAGLGQLDTAECLERLLRAERPRPNVFATMCDVAVAADRRRMVVRSAGHPPPVLLGTGGAALAPVSTEWPIGLAGTRGPDQVVDLPSRWTLLLFTDGVYEGRAGTGDRLGIDGFVERAGTLLGSGPVDEPALEALVEAAVADHGGPLPDDVGLLSCSWRSW